MRPLHVIAFCLAALGACHTADSAPPPPEDPGGSAIDWSTLSYTAIAPTPPHWTDDISARITFDETHTSRVGSPLGGRVTGVFVQLGERVTAKKPLFAVTSGDLADLYSARARAQVDLEAAKTAYERVKSLVEVNSLPKKELVAAENDMRVAELTLHTTEQKLSALHVGADGETGFTVFAPRDGVVVEKTLAVGQQVSPDNGSLVAIADLSDVWIVANVLEDTVGTLKPGGKAQVTVDGIDGPLDAKIEQVSAVVDPDRHTVPVRVALDNASGKLRPNAYAAVRFYDEGSSSLCVPWSAVLSDGASQYVYIKKAGELERRVVEVGAPSGGLAPIRSGLVAGDQVVSQGAQLLENQRQVAEISGSGSAP
jgi:RND family efflux transporter MFP subunit|nr:efflux RND transporter periplasmic adaptor subunit [Kofleriaceae bacterium]